MIKVTMVNSWTERDMGKEDSSFKINPYMKVHGAIMCRKGKVRRHTLTGEYMSVNSIIIKWKVKVFILGPMETFTEAPIKLTRSMEMEP